MEGPGVGGASGGLGDMLREADAFDESIEDGKGTQDLANQTKGLLLLHGALS